MSDRLSDEERYRVALQVDHFIEILERRTGITLQEVISLVVWAREHKGAIGKMNFFASVSIVGTVITGIAYAVLEGMRHLFSGGK